MATADRTVPRAGLSSRSERPGQGRQLLLSTVGFALNFWAWALLSPLGIHYRDALHLSAFDQSMIVAVPVIVGSLGRIPVGALTDRFGARRMFPLVSAVVILPVLYLGLVANSYAALLVGGFVLGLAGTTFAIGIPHVNGWFAPARRGTALGIFGAGMGGTAIAAFTTVFLYDNVGSWAPFVLVAVLLAAYTVVSAALVRDAAAPGPAGGAAQAVGWLTRTTKTFRLPATWQASFLYAVSFGGFVAFSVYLPAYLRNAFHLSASDAALRTAGFVVLAVVARPVGGWLSDRWHPVWVLTVCYLAATGFATIASFGAPLLPGATVAFLGLALVLGAGAGAVFALVAKLAPAGTVGAVTGVVGAAGGLGGFVPPLVMGGIYEATGHYAVGFGLLALTALGAAVFTVTVVRHAAPPAAR